MTTQAVRAAAGDRVIVPLDVESVFALDPTNSKSVAVGDGESGNVRLAFPASATGANSWGGYVQVFRAGSESVDERWLGRIDLPSTGNSAASESTFELPVGEYELFFNGFVDLPSPTLWSWLGGGYDARAARTVTVTAGATDSIDMAIDGTAAWRNSVNVMDRNRDPQPSARVTLYAVVDRDDRDELMPIATLAAGTLFTIPKGAKYTAYVAGFGRFADTWLGDVQSIDDADVYPSASGLAATVTLMETPALGVPLIEGTAAVGRKLWADHAMPRDGEYTYQWYADGSPIPGRTSGSLTVTASLAGKRISYRVGVTGWGMLPTSAMSLATPRVSVYGSPRVEGWMIPGQTMTLSPGSWPSGTKLTYQWLMNSSRSREQPPPRWSCQRMVR